MPVQSQVGSIESEWREMKTIGLALTSSALSEPKAQSKSQLDKRELCPDSGSASKCASFVFEGLFSSTDTFASTFPETKWGRLSFDAFPGHFTHHSPDITTIPLTNLAKFVVIFEFCNI